MAKKKCRKGAIHDKLCIGDKIRLTDNALDNYGKQYNKSYTITHIAKNEKEHRGYDTGVSPQLLVDTKELRFSIYEYEFTKVPKRKYTKRKVNK